jgi:hypothetical protein
MFSSLLFLLQNIVYLTTTEISCNTFEIYYMLQKIRMHLNDLWEDQGPERETNSKKIYKKKTEK